MVIATACNQGSKNNSNQGNGPGNFNQEALVDRQMEQLNEALELTAKQEKQMRTVMQEGFETMGKMREEMQNGGGFEGMRERMQELREEQNKKVKTILSEEQWVKYQEIEKERRAQRGQGRRGGQDRQE